MSDNYKIQWKNNKVWNFLRRVKRLQRAFFKPLLPKKNEVFEQVNNILIQSSLNVPQVTIITPTTGSPYLAAAIKSVQQQTFKDLVQIIVVDGPEYEDNVRNIAAAFDPEKYRIVILPYNTGKNGMNGHRIYAAFPFLINSEFIFFLDEDNWLNENHVLSIVNLIKKKSLDWAYSFRKVYTENGIYVCDDLCESIGCYQAYSGKHGLVDTNCYGLRREALIKAAPYWYHPLGADRYFFHYLKELSPKFQSTGMFTTNYRLSDKRPPQPNFFQEGNEHMNHQYNCKLPWLENTK